MSKVAVVGCGHWGKNLVRNFAELGALAAVVDPDPTLAAAQAERHGVPAHGYDEALADPEIAAVVIAAPAVLHAGLAREALLAGKHTYVEKPLALDVDEAAALCDLAEERGLTLMVGHLLQYHPAFLELKRLVAAGDLGRLRYVYSNRLNFGRFRREENALWSFAPHDISMILSLVGSEPDSVTATGSTYLHKTIADVTTTHLSFPGGEAAHVFVSWLHPVKEQKLVVVGEAGMAVFDDGQPWESKLVLYPHRIDWQDGLPQPSKADAKPVAITQDEPLKLECQHFLDSYAAGRTPRTDGREGVRVLRVLQAAQRDLEAHLPPSSPLMPATAGPSDVRIHESAYIDQPATIGSGTSIWHFSHVLAGTTIGTDCNIGQNVVIGPDVTVGDRCKIQNNVSVYKGVTLEDGVFVGPSAVFTNVTNPRAEVDRRSEFAQTRVGRGATIGANATIVCGHDLGDYCLVAAGAVVAKDVPAHALVAGVPAKRIGWVGHAGERLSDDLTCPRTGRRYRETPDGGLEAIDKDAA